MELPNVKSEISLHLLAYDTKTGTYIYLAEVGDENDWEVQDSEFYQDIHYFAEKVIEEVNDRFPDLSVYDKGQKMIEISRSLFNS